MRKKKDGSFKKVKEKIKQDVTTSSIYINSLRKRDELANGILNRFLHFFNKIAPCLTFVCTKTPDVDKTTGVSNEIR